jgi:caffeoyl-CoA O-methyltransferase
MTHIVNPVLDDYLLTHCTPADDVLRDLAAETQREAPGTTMQISQDEGAFLAMLVHLTRARLVVEVGTFTGYSALSMARALPDDGTSRLIACDVSEEWTRIARRYWERAGVADRIDLRIAPAADTLRALPAEQAVDFAFIDADKTGYPVYYEELVTRLRPGGLIALDNTLQAGRVVEEGAEEDPSVAAIRAVNDTIVADRRVESVLLPVRDGLTLVRKL